MAHFSGTALTNQGPMSRVCGEGICTCRDDHAREVQEVVVGS
jgi:hypothetical protein